MNIARRVPIPLLPKVEDELRRMERAAIIKKITQPTPWCAPMVAVPKKTDKVRKQGRAERERYIIPAISQVLAKLTGSVCFSKLDASGGYWQLALDKERSREKIQTIRCHASNYCALFDCVDRLHRPHRIRHASVTTFFVFGTLHYKCEMRLSACDEFINTDVCVTVLKGNSLNGEL